MLELANNTPRDYLLLLLLSQAGLRRDEAVNLEVVNVGEKPYVSEVKRIKIAQFP
jgi:integrase